MSATSSDELQQLKQGLCATWMTGDFGKIAQYTAGEAATFVDRLPIKSGMKVLDVACGTGNLAIPAARRGAQVTGADIATNLLAQARQRASAEKLEMKFDEGDAEHLPYQDGGFDLVMSMFGAMFAPRPELVAAELLRVCRPGGTIAMANWTRQGFVGESFAITSKHVSPPANIPPPLLWGDEAVARQRLGKGTSGLTLTRQVLQFDYPFPPSEMVPFFRQYFGPTSVAFSRLNAQGQAALAADLEHLWTKHNKATGRRTLVDAEYLQIMATRA